MSTREVPVKTVFDGPFHIDVLTAIVLTSILFGLAILVDPMATVAVIVFQQARKCRSWMKLSRDDVEVYTKWTTHSLAHPFVMLAANLAFAQGASQAQMPLLTMTFAVAAVLSFLQYMTLIKYTLRHTQP